MRRLSGRRFPDEVTRKRVLAGYRDQHGEYVPGRTVEHVFRASVQPLSLEDTDTAAGVSLIERLKVFIPLADGSTVSPLRAADDTVNADKVEYRGVTYDVVESWSWPNHVRATLLRET